MNEDDKINFPPDEEPVTMQPNLPDAGAPAGEWRMPEPVFRRTSGRLPGSVPPATPEFSEVGINTTPPMPMRELQEEIRQEYSAARERRAGPSDTGGDRRHFMMSLTMLAAVVTLILLFLGLFAVAYYYYFISDSL